MPKERDLYKGIVDGARIDGGLLVRIHDAAYTGKKPFDMFGVSPFGLALAVEVKSVDKMPRDPLSLLETHQLSWLKAWSKRGGGSFLVVHCKGRCDVWRIDRYGNVTQKSPLEKSGELWRGLV